LELVVSDLGMEKVAAEIGLPVGILKSKLKDPNLFNLAELEKLREAINVTPKMMIYIMTDSLKRRGA
jgi:hypothetical protein